MQVSSLVAYYNNQWKDKIINLNVWTDKIGTHLFAHKSEQEDFGMMWFSIHENQFGYIIQEKSLKRPKTSVKWKNLLCWYLNK